MPGMRRSQIRCRLNSKLAMIVAAYLARRAHLLEKDSGAAHSTEAHKIFPFCFVEEIERLVPQLYNRAARQGCRI
jgi:hypothetical protein